MVKRPKSPEVVEDSRFFTIFLPYPLNGDWQDEGDAKKLAWWIAECIGEENLWEILWKPSSAGMVLIQVSKSFMDHGRLLGEHRWVELLKNPTDEEKQGSSRIFHCFYNTYRDAQKDGWKITTVTTAWFDDWKPGEGDFKQPYPETYWCAVPVEDRTGKPLCRPLPIEAKSPPPQVQLPVVGSSKWVEKQAGAPSKPSRSKKHQPPDLSNAEQDKNLYVAAPSPLSEISSWGPPASASPSVSGVSSPISPTPMSGDSQLPATSAPTKATPRTAWGKPVPLQEFNNAGKMNKGKSPGWSKPVQPPAPAAGISPLTEPKPTGPVNAWDKPLKLTPTQQTGAKAAPAATTGATTGVQISNDATDAPASSGGGKTNHLARVAAAASSPSDATSTSSGLPASPAVRSKSTRTSSSRYRTWKKSNENLSKMGSSAGFAVPMPMSAPSASLLVAAAKAGLARNANKRKERERERGTSGRANEGLWSTNSSPPRRARTSPPEGYEGAVDEKAKGKDEEVKKMDVDSPVKVCVKQEGDVDLPDVEMEGAGEEKSRNKILANPLDVKMEVTETKMEVEQPSIGAAKESSDTRRSPGGVGDSMWSSRMDADSRSRTSDWASRSKPLEWGRLSSYKDKDQPESTRRWESNHWSHPYTSDREDRPYRPEVRDRDLKYSSSSRRDDRDNSSRHARNGERPYRPSHDKHPLTTDRTRERGGTHPSRSKREERAPDRDKRKDRTQGRDRDSQPKKKDRSPEKETRGEKGGYSRHRGERDDRKEDRGPQNANDTEVGTSRQHKDEAKAGQDEEMRVASTKTGTTSPNESKTEKDKQKQVTPTFSDLSNSLGTATLDPPLMEAERDCETPKGACEEKPTSWADAGDTATGGPILGDESNSPRWPMSGDDDKTVAGWPVPGDDNTASSVKRGLTATDPDFGAWKHNPEAGASKGYVPTSGDYFAHMNDKDRKPDWSERSRGSDRGQPSRGKPRDDWVSPETRDSGWSPRKDEYRKIDQGKWSDSNRSGTQTKSRCGGESARGRARQTESPQTQWTADPDGDWAGLNTSPDSQPQWTTGVSVDPDGDWAGLNAAADSQWTAVSVDPDGDWATRETGLPSIDEDQAQDGHPDSSEYVKWVPGVRGGGRGRSGRGRVRGPRVRKKKVHTIGLMRGFQDDPKEEGEGENFEEAIQRPDPEQPPNPFWYLAEGEMPEDDLAKWAIPS